MKQTGMQQTFLGWLMITAATLACGAAGTELSTEEAQEAQQTRQSVFELLSFNMEPLAAMARGTMEFNKEQAVTHAERIELLAPMIPEVFEADTRGSGAYTRAKDIIWDNWDSFVSHAVDLERAAGIMKEAAASGELSAMRNSIRTLGGACGACHDLYRFLESDPAFPFRDHPRNQD